MSKPVILTGLRANSDLHIGNYLGALLPMVDMANQRAGEYQVNLFVPDLHSFTTPIDHGKLYEQALANIKLYVAAGFPFGHEDVYIYRQSYVPAHSELTWILDCFTGFGEMSRMTQFKNKSAKLSDDRISVGLFNYPVLMACDILLYGASYVPVGEDQTQHLEFTRDIAERMNNQFSELFVLPKPVKEQHSFFGKDQGLRVRDLLDPTKKMSKSDETGKGVIFLTDSPEIARKKIMGATTDSLGEVKHDYRARPGISNLLDILKLLGGHPDEFIGQKQYGPLKEKVADLVTGFLKDFQERLEKVDEQALMQKLETSEAAMREAANQTLLRVQRAVGLRPKRAKEEKKRAGRIAKPAAVDFSDFAKLDLRIGTIETAKAIEDSDKLIELTIDFGSEKRTVVTGMREFYEPASLVGKQIPFIVNLKPQTLRGATSQGMLVAVETESGPVFLLPEKPVAPGSPLE
jgi:tryptophanyl-tRNA synthetase